jgi:Spy/CpxP family protein refolding chaperone
MHKNYPIKSIIVLLIAATLVFAGCHHRDYYHSPYGGSGHHSAEKHVEKLKEEITDRLELDEDQQQKLDDITQRILVSAKEFQTVRTSTRETFLSEFSKKEISRENLDQVIAQNRVRMDELIGVLADGIIEFHRMLTPEQRSKLVAEMEKHKEKGHWYHRRW